MNAADARRPANAGEGSPRGRPNGPVGVPESAGYRTFIGIDPGLDGAIAVLGNSDLIGPWSTPTPTLKDAKGRRQFDRGRMADVLNAFTDRFAAIEKVDAAPMRGRRQGTTSMFRFGEGYGLWLGLLQALEIPYIEVPPKAWKRSILKGIGTDKVAAIKYVQMFHPTARLVPEGRRVPHTGVADAVCIAEYARRTWVERNVIEKGGLPR